MPVAILSICGRNDTIIGEKRLGNMAGNGLPQRDTQTQQQSTFQLVGLGRSQLALSNVCTQITFVE